MAKRFTDTELWDKEWFMDLSAKHKLLIRFLFDKCDAAGVWDPNWRLASNFIGVAIAVDDLAALGNQVEIMDNGKVFLPGFIEFQYGKLRETCKPHLKVISLLKKHNLFERVSIGYTKGINTLEEKEEDKEEEKDTEGGVGETNPETLMPTMLRQFTDANRHYPVDTMLDLPSMRLIAGKILSWLGLKGQITDDANRDAITRRWGEMIVYVKADPHLSGYSITQINKYFQTIAQGLFGKNGTNSNQHRDSKPGKQTGRSQLLESLRADVNAGREQHTGR